MEQEKRTGKKKRKKGQEKRTGKRNRIMEHEKSQGKGTGNTATSKHHQQKQ